MNHVLNVNGASQVWGALRNDGLNPPSLLSFRRFPHAHPASPHSSNRLTSDLSPLARAGAVHSIVRRGGRCLIPVFALGRAQELLLILGPTALPSSPSSPLSLSLPFSPRKPPDVSPPVDWRSDGACRGLLGTKPEFVEHSHLLCIGPGTALHESLPGPLWARRSGGNEGDAAHGMFHSCPHVCLHVVYGWLYVHRRGRAPCDRLTST